MINHTLRGLMIRSYPLRQRPHLGLVTGKLLLHDRHELRCKPFEGELPVTMLSSHVFGLGRDAGVNVRDPHGGVSLVPVLSAWAGAAIRLDA